MLTAQYVSGAFALISAVGLIVCAMILRILRKRLERLTVQLNESNRLLDLELEKLRKYRQSLEIPPKDHFDEQDHS